jgi:Zn-finger nucleic acid-binding protein
MKCPTCNVDLMMSERQGVEIDYCPQCRGVWLDRGELDKILERSAAENSAPPARAQGYAPASQKGHHEGSWGDGRHAKKKKSSFLTDIFEGFGD